MAFKTVTLPGGGSVSFPQPPAAGDAGAVQTNIDALAQSLVALAATVAALKVTRTVADATARAAAAPVFVGQLAMQLDTGVLYQGTATTADLGSCAAGLML